MGIANNLQQFSLFQLYLLKVQFEVASEDTAAVVTGNILFKAALMKSSTD